MSQVVEGFEAAWGFGVGDHFVGDEGGLFVCGSAAVFLEPVFLVNAFGAEASEELSGGFVAAGALIDFLDEALGDGIVEGDAMRAPAHGIAFFFDGSEDFVEDGGCAAMGGNDGELATPLGAGLCIAEEIALIFVDCEFVEFDMSGSAGWGINAGGEGVDKAAAGKAEDIGADAFVCVEDLKAEVFGGDLEEESPVFAVVEVLASGTLVAGRDPNIESGLKAGDLSDGIEAIGVGEADLAAFFDDFEGAVIVDPALLVREQTEGMRGSGLDDPVFDAAQERAGGGRLRVRRV